MLIVHLIYKKVFNKICKVKKIFTSNRMASSAINDKSDE